MADREATALSGGIMRSDPHGGVMPLSSMSAPWWTTVRVTSRVVEIVMARLDARADRVRALSDLLSDDERRRLSRFAFDRDRRRFAVARGTLREVLGERLGADPAAITFEYGRHGKPALGAPFSSSGVRFNVTHTDEIAVFALTHEREVGVDVESVRAMPDADLVAEHFFSEAETAVFRRLAPSDRLAGFYACWTRKEAFIKAQGDGLRFPLHEFDVSLDPTEPARILRVGQTPGGQCGWSLLSFSALPGVAGAVVVGEQPVLVDRV
jgi:4'-phosphopantetheinyl transferase